MAGTLYENNTSILPKKKNMIKPGMKILKISTCPAHYRVW